MVGGQGFAGPERFGGRFDRYRASRPDRREVGSQIRKKNYRLGQRARQRIL